jgi:acetylornithine/N-succinyldiaminopimelate aminotransferase
LSEDIANDVLDRAFNLGLLINAPRTDTLRFMPSLRLSRVEVDDATTLLDEALKSG